MNTLQALEQRRLLSLTPVGGETVVPGSEGAFEVDVAVADNGSFLVATRDGRDSPLRIVRYSPAGIQLDAPIVIDATPGDSFFYIALAADADGDAVVAYFLADPETDLGGV